MTFFYFGISLPYLTHKYDHMLCEPCLVDCKVCKPRRKSLVALLVVLMTAVGKLQNIFLIG